MSQNPKKPAKRQVSPVILIVGALGLVAIGVLYFMLPAEPDHRDLVRSENGISGKAPVQEEAEPVDIEPSPDSSRDPFNPPAVVIAAAKRDKPVPVLKRVKTKPVYTKVKNEQAVPTPAIDKPVWNGVAAANGNRIVIVTYKNKTYLLKVGDMIPDSTFRLNEIGPNAICFSSPSGQLIIGKKEEAQDAQPKGIK